MKKLVSALGLVMVGTAAFAQGVPVTCSTPLTALSTSTTGWTIAGPVGPVTRTTPPPTTPPTTGYAAAVSATPLNEPPPADGSDSGYRWDPAASWISINNTGASNTGSPHYFYFKQTINLDASVDPSTFSLTYDTQTDDQLWSVYVNDVQVQAPPTPTTPIYAGFGPADGTNYRHTEKHAITVASGWQPGANTIVFAVNDFGGNTGFASNATNMVVNCTTAAPDNFPVVNTTTQTTPSVIDNDTVGGAAVVLGTNATLVPGTAPAGMTMNPDGTITVPAGTAPGSYRFPYSLCPLPASTPPNCVAGEATVVVSAAAVAVPVNDWRALGALALLVTVVSGWRLRRRPN